MAGYRGPQCRKTKEELLAYDAELFHYEDNRKLYKYITPKQENGNWAVIRKTENIYQGGIATLDEAVSIRDKLMGEI